MTQRPFIDPLVVATLTEAAPGRIQKKLDADPKLSEAWTWVALEASWEIDTGSEKVTLLAASGGAIGVTDMVQCSCLLSPRCLHVLAVIHALPLHDASAEGTEETSSTNNADGAVQSTPTAEQDEVPITIIDPAARAAAEVALRAAGRLLERGAANASLTVSNELLRAVHSARIHGLHRMSAAGLRVAESIRMYREGAPAFDRDRLLLEFRELVTVAHALSQPETDASGFVGTARRKYRDVGSKKLTGILVDPILTKTGYAGTVTYLADPDGVFWTLSDVAPGNGSRALGAYDGGVSIGDVKSAPRAICRGGLLLQGATGSEDGRLGSGKAVKAVTLKGTPVADWPMWKEPFDEQLARSFSSGQLFDRRAGDDLIFFRAVVIGVHGDNLIVQETTTGRAIRLQPPTTSAGLKFLSNLKLLGRAAGLEALFVARRSDDARDGFNALAIYAAPDAARTLNLPDDVGGLVNLGLDTLKPEHLGGLSQHPVDVVMQGEGVQDPLHALRQRVSSVVQGGRFVFHAGASHAVKRDASRLNAQFMHTAADLLSELLDRAQFAERDISGRLDRTDPVGFAVAWCAAATYLQAAEASLARAGAL